MRRQLLAAAAVAARQGRAASQPCAALTTQPSLLWQAASVRALHASRAAAAPLPALLPAAGALAAAKVWVLKPAGALLRSLTVGNVIRAARAGSMIRKSWEYRAARRLLLGSAASAALGGLAILAACDFDEDKAVAVIYSLPRTAAAAGWCLHAGWTYKTSLWGHSARILATTDPRDPAYKAALHAAHAACAARLADLCSANGGIYVKAAQFLASLQTIPSEYRSALERLQDQAEPQPPEAARRALERELGAPLEAAFAFFEPQARAAASLAQVHKAALHDGRAVAVKVQYLGLESAVTADLATLSVLGAAAALLFPGSFDFGWMVRRLGVSLDSELDFRIEAANAARMAANLANNPNVAIPATVPELSGRRVLVMEWVEGVKVSDRAGLVALGIRPRDAALQLLHAFAQMIFVHGCIHADPHSGNILVRRHPGPTPWAWRLFGFGWRRPQIVFLDHGLQVALPQALRQDYCALWCAFLVNDSATAAVVGGRIAGERGAQLLPKLLKPGELRDKERRRAFRREAGIDGLGDIGRLVEGLPDAFLQLLRLGAVVRPVANKIGATDVDRLRINATYAYKGLWTGNADVPPPLASLWVRCRMRATLAGLRTAHRVSCVLHDLFDALMFMPLRVAHRVFEARYV